jgi:hypothetical protein
MFSTTNVNFDECVVKQSAASNVSFDVYGFIKEEVDGAGASDAYTFGTISYRGRESVLDTTSKIEIYLCVDNSGSMGDQYNISKQKGEMSKNKQVLNTITNMVPYLQESTFDACDISLEVQSFDDRFDINLPLTKVSGLSTADKERLIASVADLKDTIQGRGGTDISLPLKNYFERSRVWNSTESMDRFRANETIRQAQEILSDSTKSYAEKQAACQNAQEACAVLNATNPDSKAVHNDTDRAVHTRRIFVLMTDGLPNSGDTNMERIAAKYLDPETTYYFVGYGKDHSAIVMSQLDQSRGHYLIITETEHAAFAVSDILTRIMYSWLENVVITTGSPETTELFDAVTNTWVPSLQFGSLQSEKRMDLYFRSKVVAASFEPIEVTIRGTNSSTGDMTERFYVSSSTHLSGYEERLAVQRVKSLQLLSTIHQMNQEKCCSSSVYGVFQQLSPFTVKKMSFDEISVYCDTFLASLSASLAETKISMDEYSERKLEDLISAITLVKITMNGNSLRSLIFSTILLNEWFLHTIRISKTESSDITVNSKDFDSHTMTFRGCSLGRQHSDDTSPRYLEACRSISQGSGAQDVFDTVTVGHPVDVHSDITFDIEDQQPVKAARRI